jgi:hypothetical protein
MTRARERLAARAESEREALGAAAARRAGLEAAARVLKEVDSAFGRSGIPSFVLEGLLGELQAKTSDHLQQLATGMALELRATRQLGSSSGVGAAAVASAAGGKRAAGRRRAAAGAGLSADEGVAEEGVLESSSLYPEERTKEEIIKVVKVGQRARRACAPLKCDLGRPGVMSSKQSDPI